jgi:hypothetical protein
VLAGAGVRAAADGRALRALAGEVPETVQHDDIHMANVYAKGERLRRHPRLADAQASSRRRAA